jgi:hypothetical protein
MRWEPSLFIQDLARGMNRFSVKFYEIPQSPFHSARFLISTEEPASFAGSQWRDHATASRNARLDGIVLVFLFAFSPPHFSVSSVVNFLLPPDL